MPKTESEMVQLRAEKRQRFIAAGLCAQCGKNPPIDGITRCARCTARRIESGRLYQQKKRLKWKNDNLCQTCGKLARDGFTSCDKCNIIRNQHVMTRYHNNIKLGNCAMCGNPSDKFRCDKCHKSHIINGKRRWELLRQTVLNHYGNKCACCGETRYEFLEIDHVNNNGARHRKMTGHHICNWIIKNDFPSDLQLLCANCNRGKAKFGVCPHHKTPPEPKIKSQILRRKYRLQAISAYGGKCQYCEESNWGFLEFDHINNDGKKDRIRINFARYLILNNYPSDIQLLCSNCNKAKGLYKDFGKSLLS